MSAEELSYQEVEEVLESIISNKKLVSVQTRKGTDFVILSHPSTQDTIASRYAREKALLAAKAEGLPSLEELKKTIEHRKIISEADEEKIKELEDKMAGQRRVLQITKIEGRRKPILENIERFESDIYAIKRKADDLLYLSAERKADEESLLYITWSCTYFLDGRRYWKTFADFENERDLLLRNSAIAEVAQFNAGLTTKIIRFISRHSLWRIRYSAALKVGGSLFSRDLNDLTPDQLALLYWSSYYQSVYEMMSDDRPDDDIIEDDEALDSFMEHYFKRREEERNEGKVKRRGGSSKGKLSAWDKGEELIVTAAHPEYMSLAYSDKRIKAPEDASDVEVISPNSRRAKNRREARRNRR